MVLATFSGHDHAPIPPFSTSSTGNVLYFTHSGLVEGIRRPSDSHRTAIRHPSDTQLTGPIETSNAYSVVDVLADCSIVVKG